MNIEITKQQEDFDVYCNLQQGDIFTWEDNNTEIYLALFGDLGRLSYEYANLSTGQVYDISDEEDGKQTRIVIVTSSFLLKGSL